MIRKNLLFISALAIVFIVVGLSREYIFGILAKPDFTLSADSETIEVTYWKGSKNSTIITLKSYNGFEDFLSIELKESIGITSGLHIYATPQEIYLPSDGTAQVFLNLFVRYGLAPGHYFLDLTCKGSTIQHLIRLNINVVS